MVVKSIPWQFFPPTSRHMAAAVNLGETDVASLLVKGLNVQRGTINIFFR